MHRCAEVRSPCTGGDPTVRRNSRLSASRGDLSSGADGCACSYSESTCAIGTRAPAAI